MKSFAIRISEHRQAVSGLLFLLMMAGFCRPVQAADVTYTFRGDQFNVAQCQNQQTQGCGPGSITASFTFPDTVVASGQAGVNDFTSWTVSSPAGTLSSANGDLLEQAFINFDGLTGNVTDWDILAGSPDGSKETTFWDLFNGTSIFEETILGGGPGQGLVFVGLTSSPGSWTGGNGGGNCQVNVTVQRQVDDSWAGDPYDHYPGKTIGAKGCGLTALSMALNFAGLRPPTNPGDLNTFMAGNDTDYKGKSVNWVFATRDAFLKFAGKKNSKFNYTAINSDDDMQAATQYLNSTLCLGNHPVIVGVNLKPDGTPTHFVLVTGKQGNDYSIIDPGSALHPKTVLSQYNNFETRGFAVDPPGDISELYVGVDDPAEISVTNSSGQKTGYDPSSKEKKIQQIPQSAYFRDAITDDVTGEPPDEIDHQLQIPTPSQGTYQILVTGLKTGIYSLTVGAYSQDGSKQPVTEIKGIAGPNSTSLFSIQLNTIPGATSTVIAKATFQGTLDDINNSFVLRLIDNQGVANSLSQKIQAAQKANSPARANILYAFANEVRAQVGHHINGEALEVLLRDANSLLAQEL